MKLLIVESPSKAKTLGKWLPKDFKVTASFGHIRDLPSKAGSVLPDEDFLMKYEVNDNAKKHVKEISDLAKEAEEIYLAPDPDREGEAIAWHIVEVLKQKKIITKSKKVYRVVFNEITKKAVLNAVQNPRDINISLVNSQQARRGLDYLVGFEISPILWRKLPGSRSAGRVQSVALRLICSRESEIEKFKSEEYWSIHGDFLSGKKEVSANLVTYNGEKLEKFSFRDEKTADSVVSELSKHSYSVLGVESKKLTRNPQPPFTTSTLQQEASRKLGFGAKMTMQVAQKLYEGIKIDNEVVGLITYMRTDGVQISEEALNSTRNYIKKTYGDKYLPNKPRQYVAKAKNAQEAHEAIRPTYLNYTPDYVKPYLSDVEFKLYDLIWKRLIASQMESVILNSVSVNIGTSDSKHIFRATGSTIDFDGFYKVYIEDNDDSKSEDEKILPKFDQGEKLDVKDIRQAQHFTDPPPRYSEASLVKKLEELGIGRPSTYASIISVLQDREYVMLDKKRFIPEERGRVVNAFMEEFFEKYVQYSFTANMEEQLDEISEGKKDWKKLLSEFWEGFIVNIKFVSEKNIEEVISRVEKHLEDYIFFDHEKDQLVKDCPKCDNGNLRLSLGKFGPFVSCSNYPECNFTKSNLSQSSSDAASVGQSNIIQLGKHPENEMNISLRQGPYGPYVQLGETSDGKKVKRVAIPKNINPADVSFEMSIKLVSMPYLLGKHPETEEDIMLGIGKFGPFAKYNSNFYSIPKNHDIFNLSINEVLNIIEKKDSSGASKSKPTKKSTAKTTRKKKT